LSNYQQVQSIKQQQLIKLQHQLKINEINLVKNIDEVKIFIAANTNKLYFLLLCLVCKLIFFVELFDYLQWLFFA
jgi:hypothetical protein